MSDYRTLNRTILVKNETTPGTDAGPTPADDAIKVEDPNPTPGLNAEQTNEVTGSLDASAAVPNGAAGGFGCVVLAKGSGAAGQVPEYAPLLKSCSLAETLRAADEDGTAAAGGADTITLAAGHTAKIGDPITLTGGLGQGQTRVITALAGDVATIYPDWTTVPDVTSQYRLPASAAYVPATAGLAHSTVYDYQHASSQGGQSRLRAYTGWLGNMVFNLPTGQIGRFNFTGQARYIEPTDVAYPGPATYDTQRPGPFVLADMTLAGKAVRAAAMSLDLGNAIAISPDPADRFGVHLGHITRRRIVGRLNPPMDSLGERNVVEDFLNGTPHPLWVRYGTPNNALSLFIPRAIYTGQENEDLNGLTYEGIPFHAEGEDSGIYLTIY